MRGVRDTLIGTDGGITPEAPLPEPRNIRVGLSIDIPQAENPQLVDQIVKDVKHMVETPLVTPERIAEISAKLGWTAPQKRSNITNWKAKVVDNWLFELGIEGKGNLRERQNIVKDILFPKGD